MSTAMQRPLAEKGRGFLALFMGKGQEKGGKSQIRQRRGMFITARQGT